MQVEVVRSARRRKTVEARQLAGVLRVSIPAAMSKAEEERWVALMIERMRPKTADRIDLVERAAVLARRYQLRQPRHIRWVSNMVGRWGSCTPTDSSIRISTRLAEEPAWVLDYVIVHELAHLSRDRHDAAFWSIVNRYPKAERARGFLMARGLEPE